MTTHGVVEHFTARASHYNRSARWCNDPEMLRLMVELAGVGPGERVLDAACGTGLVSQAIRGHVKQTIGVDLTPAMCTQALPFVDALVLGSLETLPFASGAFDLAMCRQGIQFCNAAKTVTEMARVTRRGGRVLIVNLCAYSDEDRDEFFEIMRLRNPARQQFFVRDDLGTLLERAGCGNVQITDYVSVEDVEAWADNQAIPTARLNQIPQCYEAASPAFRRLHKVEFAADGRIIDHMLFAMAVGTV